MRAIILVGGYGTRLQSILPDLPKPMAPVGGKPFLAHLLDYLAAQRITDITFAAHYLWKTIYDYFQLSYQGMSIDYVVETEPLGTGGAIINALQQHNIDQPVFVLNGDTFVKMDYQAMYASISPLTMALCVVSDGSRYGSVVVENGAIVGFKEKGNAGPCLINAGVYLLKPNVFNQFRLPAHFSFEHDFLLPNLTILKPSVFITEGNFIDIGVPEDYARAETAISN